jgi:cytidyltransferase-like protein
MTRVFVSGCYDIIHAGHIEFFKDAKMLGDHLTVCFASEDVLYRHKNRKSSLPDDHKEHILKNLKCVDDVVRGENAELGLDFKDHFLKLKPNILAVTEDDKFSDLKKQLCEKIGAEYVVLEKRPPLFEPISTSDIIKHIKAPIEASLRVDFAGGWLDVPKYFRHDGYVVNCAITPLVSLKNWCYEKQSGLGGSGAWAILKGENAVDKELNMGAGWQDPAIISETGCCVWFSGIEPRLEIKNNGDFLKGKMALYWTGVHHNTDEIVKHGRDYDKISNASRVARDAVYKESIAILSQAISLSYDIQMTEGMKELPIIETSIAKKYCGSGHGGYGLYLFSNEKLRNEAVQKYNLISIEPYCKK